MYSENAPYNASWLESNGQYNASSVYPEFWTQLTGVELNGSLNAGNTIEISGKTMSSVDCRLSYRLTLILTMTL
jgi:hypothetical protein